VNRAEKRAREALVARDAEHSMAQKEWRKSTLQLQRQIDEVQCFRACRVDVFRSCMLHVNATVQLSGQLTAAKEATVTETQRGGSIAATLNATKGDLSTALQSLQDKSAALAGLELRVTQLTEDRTVLEGKVRALETQLSDRKAEVNRSAVLGWLVLKF
jgi:hypothetical protein